MLIMLLSLQFVLLVGDSHLRAIVDGYVRMPLGGVSFALLSVPGAKAAAIEKEVRKLELPRTPEAVVILAPSNNLDVKISLTESAADFGRLLSTACAAWRNVSYFFFFCCYEYVFSEFIL